MKYHYLFMLGTNPAIAAAELLSILPQADYSLQDSILYYSGPVDPGLIRRLGGTIKIARIIEMTPDTNISFLASLICSHLQPENGKFKIGFSVYPPLKLDGKKLGMTAKNILKKKGSSVRWVTSREQQLSSVVVEQNGLLKNGAEIILTYLSGQVVIARTESVQLFKELSFRDYGRPGRDDHSGMLPPKLAQIMLNLSGADANSPIMDPFCGSGTILTEAMLMSYTKIFGSDLSAKAVADSRNNIEWIKEKYQIKTELKSLCKLNAVNLSGSFAPDSIQAIVTEPFLGPQRGKIDPVLIIDELNRLYSEVLAQFSRILKDGGRVVMIWPALTERESFPRHYISPNITGLKIKKILPKSVSTTLKNYLSPRGHLLYGRPGQKVWREIVVLEK